MSESNSVITRVAVGLFFVAIAAGGYAFMTQSDLQAAEQKLASVEKERASLKTELIATEKTVLSNSSDLRTCTKEVESLKGRAQSAESAVHDLKAPKQSKSPRSAL